MTKKSIKVLLLVEDNPGDARLLREMFKEQGLHGIDLTHVGCMGEAEVHLGQTAFDMSWHFFRLANATKRKDIISAGRCYPSNSPSCSRAGFPNRPLWFIGEFESCHRIANTGHRSVRDNFACRRVCDDLPAGNPAESVVSIQLPPACAAKL
jgi:hypothetical protein